LSSSTKWVEPPSTRGTREPCTAAARRRFCFAPGWPRLRLNSVPLSPCVRCRKSGDMSPQSQAAPHFSSNSFELLCVRTTSEICIFPSLCAELTGVTAPFHARDENTLDCGGTTPLLFRAWLASAALEFSAAFAL